jgi:hypothetical protein
VGRKTRILGGASILLAPLAIGTADQLRMAAEGAQSAGAVDGDWNADKAADQLAAIASNSGTFEAAGWFSYAAVLLLVPALLAIWRLSADRAPRWATAGAVMAALGVVGATVHVTGYYALSQVLSQQGDLQAAGRLQIDMEELPFTLALFAPFFLGILCTIPQAVGLRRARVIPLWACVALIAGTLMFMVAGSVPASSAIWTALMVAGFAPAALALVRGEHAHAEVATAQPIPAT